MKRAIIAILAIGDTMNIAQSLLWGFVIIGIVASVWVFLDNWLKTKYLIAECHGLLPQKDGKGEECQLGQVLYTDEEKAIIEKEIPDNWTIDGDYGPIRILDRGMLTLCGSPGKWYDPDAPIFKEYETLGDATRAAEWNAREHAQAIINALRPSRVLKANLMAGYCEALHRQAEKNEKELED